MRCGTIIDCEQGSETWLLLRCGKVSASRMADLMAKVKSGPAASRANYLAEIVAERLTGKPAERYKNVAMDWGTQQEGAARALYCFMYDVEVKQIGLVLHPELQHACASPDGLIAQDGLIEIKAPNTATHISTLLTEDIDTRYIKQMNWQLNLTARSWCDYVSFDPRLPVEMQLFRKRVFRDDLLIKDMEREVRSFLAEVEEKVERLRKIYMKEAA